MAALALAACKPGGDDHARAGEQQAAGATARAGDQSAAGGRIDQYEGVQLVEMREFTGDRPAAAAGRQAFLKYNCYGCHGGLAGGAMGPSLRDDEWKFGGTDEQIHESIHKGRPGGMPAWEGKMSEAEMRDIITYVHSLRSATEPTFFFSVDDTTTRTARAYR